MNKKLNTKKYPKGTLVLNWTRNSSVYVTPKIIVIIFSLIELMYIFAVQGFDLIYKNVSTGNYLSSDLYGLSYIPVMIFALVIAYGLISMRKTSRTFWDYLFIALMTFLVLGAAVIMYFYLTIVFHLAHHYRI